MVLHLRTIYSRGHQRSGSTAWYKKPTEGASCPEENRGVTLAKSYLDAFGCNNTDSKEQINRKIYEAMTCASERMAQMDHVFKQDIAPDRDHIYPIKLAYGLGKQCVGNSRSELQIDDYNIPFTIWYNELTRNGKREGINALFQENDQRDLNQNMHNPLTDFNVEKNTGIRRALATRATSRSAQQQERILYQPIRSGAGAGAGAAAAASRQIVSVNTNNMNINNNQRSVNSNNFLSSSFAQQKPKGKKKQGGRRQTRRRRALHKKATRRR
jgi:hypothetical protein